MNRIDRRQWLARALAGGAGLVAGTRGAGPSAAAQPAPAPTLQLTELQPKSMLHVPVTSV